MSDNQNRQMKLSKDEESAISSTVGAFLKSYLEKDAKTSDGEWLLRQLTASLPEKSAEYVEQIRDAITGEISRNEELKVSLEKAHSRGISREHWFASRLRKATADLSSEEAGKCLQRVYSALEDTNSALFSDRDGEEIIDAEIVSSPSLFQDGQEVNEYTFKNAARNIVQTAGMAGLQGVLSGANHYIDQHFPEGQFDAGQFIESSLEKGGTSIKTVVAGALETVAEKGLLSSLPSGTPASVAANISNIAVENVRTFSDLASGKISMSESIEKIGDTAVETVCGFVESTLQQYGPEAGTMIGGYIGSIFSPVGTAVGAFVGNVIGTFAGSKVGQAVTKGVKKVYGYVKENIFKPVANAAASLWEGAKSFFASIFS